ncbi:MAG: phosphoribosylaminoimidazolesuccinocarboxamide synthase [Candidatus Altiarchaeales archaeon ex4484_2]|nr:MAG: phosphoribosylaminoimidazolesuccinocarboxamide synthase [Candidatus Altiarchaeales archaeon ex4484_2]
MLLETNLPLKLYSRGKVRDIYILGDRLLIIATDRISAFDCILPSGIPDKGKVLNQLSAYWFDYTKNIVDNHMLSIDMENFPPELKEYSGELDGRAMLVNKTERIDIECVVRGYLAGSGWKEYQESGLVCGIKLPSGLVESDKLSEPIFTPAIKASTGHDENVSQDYMAELIGEDLTKELREISIRIYEKASLLAEKKGIIIADTKFEYGLLGEEVILIDEVLTPDSSRFWPADDYEKGRNQKSFDKQFVRDYLNGLDWDKNPPAPELPEDVVKKTSEKYLEAYRRLTGEDIL